MKKMLLLASLVALCATPALAWGTAGHKIISHAAMNALPDSLPAFVRSSAAIAEVTALGPELDRSKDSGDPHDNDEDPGHYINAADDLLVAGVVNLDAMPEDRQAYDVALQAAHSNEYRMGFLPYSIMDGWEQVRKDFAYWHADDYLATHGATAQDRAWFAHDRALRETLTLRDIGVWGHYVGDGSQPLHVTVHYNGWGKYPNPKNYSTSYHVHSNFEGTYVRNFARQDAVAKIVRTSGLTVPYTVQTSAGQTAAVLSQIQNYLVGSTRAVVPLYELEQQGAFSAAGSARGTDFVDHQLARGASELRNLIVLADKSSLSQDVAYPLIPLRDILDGKVLPSPKAFGGD